MKTGLGFLDHNFQILLPDDNYSPHDYQNEGGGYCDFGTEFVDIRVGRCAQDDEQSGCPKHEHIFVQVSLRILPTFEEVC